VKVEEVERVSTRRLIGPALLLVLVLAAGCRQEYPEDLEYSFTPYPRKVDREGRETKEVFEVPAADQAELTKALKPYFGTPRHPIVAVDEEIKNNPEMRLDDQHLAEGSHLYRKLCLYCHGINGDASGPTGPYLEPRPRDFRRGLFKFRSTAGTAPSREDLKKTMRMGVPGASMPSFNVLTEDELEALASYVIHLSLRGQVQQELATTLQQGGDISSEVEGVVKYRAQSWLDDAKRRYESKAQIEWQKLHAEGVATDYKRGAEIYRTTGACVQCHGVDGRASTLELATNLNRRNDWGDLNVPRDLTLGVYRGGSRPIDLFYRIKLGILGSGMPAPAADLTDEDVWYIVDFVMSLPQKRY
jgi:mono/diheme cytochrome c family protein